MTDRQVGLLGATSLVGECLIPLLLASDVRICAFSRKTITKNESNGIIWRSLSASSPIDIEQIKHWICIAPIWTLPEHFPLLESSSASRVVALSSTSCFTKIDSPDAAENTVAIRLIEGEERFKAWAGSKGIEWVILRPTLIYGYGQDKNIAEIAGFIRRFGFFPLFGKAGGLRQPIHAQDVAEACMSALQTPGIVNRAYNLVGGETLSYRNMVARVFTALDHPPRLLSVSLSAFRIAVALLRCLPRYRHWSVAMAERMNRDLVFDCSEAMRDFGFKPRVFVLSKEDVALRTDSSR